MTMSCNRLIFEYIFNKTIVSMRSFINHYLDLFKIEFPSLARLNNFPNGFKTGRQYSDFLQFTNQ